MGQGVYRKRKLWAAGGRTELEALTLDPWASRRRRELLAILDRLDPSLAELDRAVAQEAEQRPAARGLMEQPGVGPVTALMFVLTIGPVERFRRSKQVVSYLGLNPRESSSGGRQRLGAIRKQGNSMARYLLVEAAQTAARVQTYTGIAPVMEKSGKKKYKRSFRTPPSLTFAVGNIAGTLARVTAQSGVVEDPRHA